MGNSSQRLFVFPVDHVVRDGDSVTIEAIPGKQCIAFAIRLCCGPSLDHDIALQIDVWFDRPRVLRNSQHHGTWAKQEDGGSFPFSKGVKFCLQIEARPDCFEIHVNDRKICSFDHRMPKELIHSVQITGDLELIRVALEPNRGASGQEDRPEDLPALTYPHPDPPLTVSYQAIHKPTVPLSIPVRGGMAVGRIVYLKGTVLTRDGPDVGFRVDLACGPKGEDDVALHLIVKFNWDKDNINVLVRNAKVNGSWGTEEKEMEHFPFRTGEDFELMILACDSNFMIAVNNQHFTHFNHRLYPITRAAHLKVKGDVKLTQIRFQ